MLRSNDDGKNEKGSNMSKANTENKGELAIACSASERERIKCFFKEKKSLNQAILNNNQSFRTLKIMKFIIMFSHVKLRRRAGKQKRKKERKMQCCRHGFAFDTICVGSRIFTCSG